MTYSSEGRDQQVFVPWGPLQVSSRLPVEGNVRVGIVDSAPPLDPRFERSPATLRALFLVIAFGLGLAGAALVAAALWPSSYFAQRRQRRLSPLERSLQQVEAAAAGDDEATRRKTLDDLATHLSEIPSPSLEGRTRALAWGQDPPESGGAREPYGTGAGNTQRQSGRLMVERRPHRRRTRQTLHAARHPERRYEARSRRPPAERGSR